jgi:hypothetical protein
MAGPSVKIELSLIDAAAQKALNDFINKTGSGDKSLNNLKKSGESTFGAITASIGKSLGVYDIFVGNLAANLATKALDTLTNAASFLFKTFVTDGVKAAQAEQDAINSLNQALAQTGQYSKATSQDIQDFAAQLQATTTVENDVVLQNAALIQSLGGLEKEGLKRATAAAVDMSAALGIDLTAAATLVGKAAAGEVGSFSRYGLAIEKGATSAETLSNALTALETKFGGAAASKVNTYSGAVSQLNNTFGDLTEEFGNLIIKNPAIIAAITQTTKLIAQFTETTKAGSKSMTTLVGEGFVTFVKASAFAVTAIDVVIRAFQSLYGAALLIIKPFVAIGTLIRSFSVGFQKAASEFEAFSKHASANFQALGNVGEGALGDLAVKMLEVGEAANQGLGEIEKGADGTVEPINRATVAVKELSKAEQERRDKLVSFSKDLIKQSEDNKANEAARIEELKSNTELEQQLLKEKLDNNQISYVEYQMARDEIDAQFNAERDAAQAEREAAELARLQETRDLGLISRQEFETARLQIIKNAQTLENKQDLDNRKNIAKNRATDLKAEKELQDKKVSAVASTFGNLKVLMQTTSRELFAIGKAAAIAESTINTYQAITKTMASVPYPFNIPLAVAQGIAGFVQVANIAKTQPSFESGGVVGGFKGATAGADNVNISARTGEMFLNASQQKQLFNVANGGGGNSNVESLLTRLIQSVENQPIVVTIGSRTVVDTIRSELRTGRAFA